MADDSVPAAVTAQRLMALHIPTLHHRYTERDTMLYALAVGAGADPLDETDLRWTHEEALQALPTLATVVAWDRSWTPASGIDWPRVVHGDQQLRLLQPLAPAAHVRAEACVTQVLDKGAGRGALVRVQTSLFDAGTGQALAVASTGFFARGNGGCGSAGPPAEPPVQLPTHPPDHEARVRTLPQQALLYRLCGDRNPIHAVPGLARRSGFERPVLHGLCSYGMAARVLVRAFAEGDASRLATLDVRFSSPLYPGETLHFECWQDGPLQLLFRARCAERGHLVLDQGRATLR